MCDVQLKRAVNSLINIRWSYFLFFCGGASFFVIVLMKRASTVPTHAYHLGAGVTCEPRAAPTVGTGAPLFKVSPWALKLWLRGRRDPSAATATAAATTKSLQHSSQLQNITGASPGRHRGETWSGREGRIHHNNSCFQITTTWGRGVGYILWVEWDHGCSFIYLHSQHWCVCVRVCVRVNSARVRQDASLPSSTCAGRERVQRSAEVTTSCGLEEASEKKIRSLVSFQNAIMTFESSRSHLLFALPSPCHFHRCHFSVGIIALRAISYFKYANTTAASLLTGYIGKKYIQTAAPLFLKGPVSTYFLWKIWKGCLCVSARACAFDLACAHACSTRI